MSQRRDIDDRLRRGDQLLEGGDTSGAIEQYLLYCALLESIARGQERNLRLRAVRRRVVELAGDRSDVRRALAEDYIRLGLLPDAVHELKQVAQLCAAHADDAETNAALKRLEELGECE